MNVINKAGPGPGAYLLPPTVGFENHDASRYRNPQYSMRGKYGTSAKSVGPGPQYDVENMTRYGKPGRPAYSLSSRWKNLESFKPPGPGTYSPENAPRMKEPRPPAYTMSRRFPTSLRSDTPGPNQYTQPTTIGPKVPDLRANAAYTMVGKHDSTRSKEKSPGPAQYSETRADLYKQKQPLYTMIGRHDPLKGAGASPGPAAYLPQDCKCRMNGYSFGHRTINSPYVSADDNMPCVTQHKKC